MLFRVGVLMFILLVFPFNVAGGLFGGDTIIWTTKDYNVTSIYDTNAATECVGATFLSGLGTCHAMTGGSSVDTNIVTAGGQVGWVDVNVMSVDTNRIHATNDNLLLECEWADATNSCVSIVTPLLANNIPSLSNSDGTTIMSLDKYSYANQSGKNPVLSWSAPVLTRVLGWNGVLGSHIREELGGQFGALVEKWVCAGNSNVCVVISPMANLSFVGLYSDFENIIASYTTAKAEAPLIILGEPVIFGRAGISTYYVDVIRPLTNNYTSLGINGFAWKDIWTNALFVLGNSIFVGNVDMWGDLMVIGKTNINDVNLLNAQVYGDLNFMPLSGGLEFGEIYVSGNMTADVTIVAQDTWTQVTDFNVNGEFNNVSPDHTNDHVTVHSDGVFRTYCDNLTVYLNEELADITAQFMLRTNNGGTDLRNTLAAEHMFQDTYTSVSGVAGLNSLSAGDTVELWVKNLDDTENLRIFSATCGALKVGG